MPLSLLREAKHVDWRAFIERRPDEVMFQLDVHGRVVWISDNVQRILGIGAAQLVGTDLIGRVHPDDRAAVLDLRAAALAGSNEGSVALRVMGVDGEYRELQGTARAVKGPDASVVGLVITWNDINYQVGVIQAFATLAEGSRVLLRAESEQSLLQEMCEAATRVGGYAFAWYGIPVDDEEKSVRIVAVAGDDMGYTKTLRTSWGDGPLAQGPTGLSIKTGETQVRNNLAEDPRFAPWLKAANRRGIHCSIALPVLVGGEVHGALMVCSQVAGSFDDKAQELLEALSADLGYGLLRFRDADALAASRAALEHEVDFDSLTGLAKKGVTLERIQEVLDSRHAPGWALLCVGVDGMTAVNQAFTYRAGDAVLCEVADRLVAAAGAHDRVGRIAGDEFVVLLREVISPTDAVEAAQRLAAAARGPLEFEGEHIEISASVGIVMAEGGDAEALMRDAAAAMRAASRSGYGQWAFLDENVALNSRNTLETQAQLREALAVGEITAWFMPVVRLESGQVIGYEALARWIRPDGTVTPPDEFLRVAERSHLILEIDSVILRAALDTLARIDDAQHIAVNVSAASLQAGHLATTVRQSLEASGVDPRRLHLEVTETALLNVSAQVRQSMQDVAELGITWWLDDFGTGYSSISHLRDLPINGVKLDQTFTAGLRSGDPHAARLTRGLAGLADGLDLRTVAEGVETAEQAALLYGQGWECAQGWHFGKPAPLSE